MDGFGSHTYQWMNSAAEAFWVKYHFKTDQGIECFTSEEAADMAGKNPNYHHLDLLQSIEKGEFPSWTVSVQVMPLADAVNYRFNPFDLTKVWPFKDYPKHEIGRMVLDRNPDNYFAEVEQSAFNPANFVPGIGPSPDKMLQGRLFSYGDAQRYRLGINHTALPVNSAKAANVANYGRDGSMRFDANGGRAKNYEPNSFNGPAQTNQAQSRPLEMHGVSGAQKATLHREDNDFVQAGDLYRLMSEAEKVRLVENISQGLAAVSRDDIIERSISHFTKADADYGRRISERVKSLRKSKGGVPA